VDGRKEVYSVSVHLAEIMSLAQTQLNFSLIRTEINTKCSFLNKLC